MVSRITWVSRSSSKTDQPSCSLKVNWQKGYRWALLTDQKVLFVWIRELLLLVDYINGVLYELENGDTSKPSSKEDWDSAITFTARTSGEKRWFSSFSPFFSPPFLIFSLSISLFNFNEAFVQLLEKLRKFWTNYLQSCGFFWEISSRKG